MPNEPSPAEIPHALRTLLIEYAEAEDACRRAQAVGARDVWETLPEGHRQEWTVLTQRRESLRQAILSLGRTCGRAREAEADQREREDEVRHDVNLRDYDAAVRT